jgi:DNA-binding NtrC family response regulator
MRELTRPRVVVPLTPPAAQEYAPAFHAPPSSIQAPPAPAAAPPPAVADEEEDDGRTGPAPAAQDGRRLAEVAREAALAAERTVIADTLRNVQWNRRKAAQLLGVSYKTLLNKIKETGLERP